MTTNQDPVHTTIDWHRIEKVAGQNCLPTIAIIGDPPRDLTIPEYGEAPATTLTHKGLNIYCYIPEAWEIKPNGDIELSYFSASGHIHTFCIKSTDYHRAHAINPMSDGLSEPKIMEYSDMRMTISPATKQKEEIPNRAISSSKPLQTHQ